MKNGLVRDWSFHSLPSSSDPYVLTSLFFHNIFGGYLQIKKLYSPRDISYFLLSMFFLLFLFLLSLWKALLSIYKDMDKKVEL
jgi:hypothetical protein